MLIVLCMVLCNLTVKDGTVLDNIQWAFSRFPCFVLGMAIGKGCKENKTLNILWIALLALAFVLLRLLIKCNNVGWLLSPLVLLVVTIVTKWICQNKVVDKCLVFMGKISLESYLINITLNTLLSLIITSFFTSTIFYGKYLQYSIVIFLGIYLAYVVYLNSQKVLMKMT